MKLILKIDDDTLRSRQRGGMVTEVRSLAAWAVSEFSNGTISELGRYVGRDVSKLSACIKRMINKARNDSSVAAKMELVRQSLENKAIKQV